MLARASAALKRTFEGLPHISCRKCSEEFILRSAGKFLMSFREGGQRTDDCSAHEILLWLLIEILRQVSRRKPLGDQKAEETINVVYETERDYTQMRAKLDP